MENKRILLVNPKTVNKYYHVKRTPVDTLFSKFFKWSYHRKFNIPTHSPCTTIPPMSLYAIKALIDHRCEVLTVDEQVANIDFDIDVDLACLTSTTPQIRRAYQIAAVFSARGIPTVIGGVHATCLPDECQKYFNTVCVGEAEGYMDQLLEDFLNGQLARRYVNRKLISMDDTPFCRYDIAEGMYLPFHVINFSRGCPFNCEFCSIQSTLGSYRTRSVDSLLKEIKRVGSRNLWFPDATLTGSPKKAKELFTALKPLNIRWLGQITMNVASDPMLLDLMAESGCWFVGIGFESLSEKNIETASKSQNKVEDYEKIIRELHQRNIAIEGDFVFGFDEDDDSVFDATAEFVINAGIDLPEFYVLTPYPGTGLFKRLKAQGRIVDSNWSHYDNTHFHYLPVFEPRNMSRENLREGCRRAERKVYMARNTVRRIWRSRVLRMPSLIANYIYSSRIETRHDLIPLSEQLTDGPIPEPLFSEPAEASSVGFDRRD